MTLVPYDVTKLNTKGYKMSKNQKLLEEFLNSDMTCAEVKDFTTVNGYGYAASLNQSIKRFRMANIRAISRSGRVFLIKTPIG